LKEDGTYKIFFVCKEDSLRVRPADIRTMQVILEAAPSITSYGLIINRISPKSYKKLSNPDLYDTFLRPFNTQLPQKPSKILFMLEDPDLAEEDDVLKRLTPDVEDELHNLEGILIKQAEVGALNVADWEEMINDLEAQVAKSNGQLEEMRATMIRDRQASEEARKIDEEQRRALQEQLEHAKDTAKEERERTECLLNDMQQAYQLQLECDREEDRRAEQAREERQREEARQRLQGDIAELQAACREAANCKTRGNESARVFDRNRQILLKHGGYCDNRNAHFAGIYIMDTGTMEDLERALRRVLEEKRGRLSAGLHRG